MVLLLVLLHAHDHIPDTLCMLNLLEKLILEVPYMDLREHTMYH